MSEVHETENYLIEISAPHSIITLVGDSFQFTKPANSNYEKFITVTVFGQVNKAQIDKLRHNGFDLIGNVGERFTFRKRKASAAAYGMLRSTLHITGILWYAEWEHLTGQELNANFNRVNKTDDQYFEEMYGSVS